MKNNTSNKAMSDNIRQDKDSYRDRAHDHSRYVSLQEDREARQDLLVQIQSAKALSPNH